ncbi:hypothetical protein J6590_030845 [Homalodisca vitripennis]|nr:hypothetical protein J6590_030845 [Homalodisca vitripennis]
MDMTGVAMAALSLPQYPNLQHFLGGETETACAGLPCVRLIQVFTWHQVTLAILDELNNSDDFILRPRIRISPSKLCSPYPAASTSRSSTLFADIFAVPLPPAVRHTRVSFKK